MGTRSINLNCSAAKAGHECERYTLRNLVAMPVQSRETCGKRASKILVSEPYSLRIPEGLLSLVDFKAREDRTDRVAVLSQLLYAGAEDYVIELLKRGRISASRAAKVLDVSLYKVHELARERGAEAASGLEDHDRGQETTGRLLG